MLILKLVSNLMIMVLHTLHSLLFKIQNRWHGANIVNPEHIVLSYFNIVLTQVLS